MKYLAVLIAVVLILGSLVILNTIYPFSPRLANITNSISATVSDNWQGFLFSKNEDAPEPDPSDQNATQAYIQAEVARIVDLRLSEMSSRVGGQGSNGLVVVPASEAVSTDVIAQSFSDEVEVYPDSTGKGGVIVPVFSDGRGEPFLYILTPIRPQ